MEKRYILNKNINKMGIYTKNDNIDHYVIYTLMSYTSNQISI